MEGAFQIAIRTALMSSSFRHLYIIDHNASPRSYTFIKGKVIPSSCEVFIFYHGSQLVAIENAEHLTAMKVENSIGSANNTAIVSYYATHCHSTIPTHVNFFIISSDPIIYDLVKILKSLPPSRHVEVLSPDSPALYEHIKNQQAIVKEITDMAYNELLARLRVYSGPNIDSYQINDFLEEIAEKSKTPREDTFSTIERLIENGVLSRIRDYTYTINYVQLNAETRLSLSSKSRLSAPSLPMSPKTVAEFDEGTSLIFLNEYIQSKLRYPKPWMEECFTDREVYGYPVRFKSELKLPQIPLIAYQMFEGFGATKKAARKAASYAACLRLRELGVV